MSQEPHNLSNQIPWPTRMTWQHHTYRGLCRHVWRHALGLALVVSFVYTQPAHAQSRKYKARVQYEVGLQAMAKKQYDTAIVHFTRALELRPRPAIYFALGLAHERSGSPEVARGFYERVLEYGKKRRARLRKDVLRRTEEALKRLDAIAEAPAPKVREPEPTTGTVQVRSDAPNASVHENGALLGLADGTQLPLNVGSHTLEVRAPGYETATIRIVVKAQRPLTLQVSLTAAKPVAEPFTPYEIAAISTAAVAGAALITGIVLTVEVENTRGDLKTARSTGQLDTGSDKAVRAWLKRTEAASWGMYAIAGASAITSLTLFLIDDTSVAISPNPIPSGGLLSLSGRW